MTPHRLSLLFRVDAVANVAIGVAALALALAPEVLGVPPLALVVVGVLVLGNAVDLARTGRQARPEAGAVRRAAGADLVFGTALLAVAAVGLPGQSEAARWLLAGLGDVSLLLGALKLLGLRQVRLVAG